MVFENPELPSSSKAGTPNRLHEEYLALADARDYQNNRTPGQSRSDQQTLTPYAGGIDHRRADVNPHLTIHIPGPNDALLKLRVPGVDYPSASFVAQMDKHMIEHCQSINHSYALGADPNAECKAPEVYNRVDYYAAQGDFEAVNQLLKNGSPVSFRFVGSEFRDIETLMYAYYDRDDRRTDPLLGAAKRGFTDYDAILDLNRRRPDLGLVKSLAVTDEYGTNILHAINLNDFDEVNKLRRLLQSIPASERDQLLNAKNKFGETPYDVMKSSSLGKAAAKMIAEEFSASSGN